MCKHVARFVCLCGDRVQQIKNNRAPHAHGATCVQCAGDCGSPAEPHHRKIKTKMENSVFGPPSFHKMCK